MTITTTTTTTTPVRAMSAAAAAELDIWADADTAADTAARVAARLREQPALWDQAVWARPAAEPDALPQTVALGDARRWAAECGTAACVAGWAALIGGTFIPDEVPIEIAGAAALGLPAPGGDTSDIDLFGADMDIDGVLDELDRLADGGAAHDAIARALDEIPDDWTTNAIDDAADSAVQVDGHIADHLPDDGAQCLPGWAGEWPAADWGCVDEQDLWAAWCRRVHALAAADAGGAS